MQNENQEIIDDVVFDEDADSDNTRDAQSVIKKLKEKIKKLESEKSEYLNGWQRVQADFVNYKKDESTRSLNLANFAKQRFAESLFPVLDAYDMAFANREAWEKVDENWRRGVEYIHQQLINVLAENGISEIDTMEGSAFDASIHESVESVKTDDSSLDHKINKIIQKGYKTDSIVLRPSRVKVWTI